MFDVFEATGARWFSDSTLLQVDCYGISWDLKHFDPSIFSPMGWTQDITSLDLHTTLFLSGRCLHCQVLNAKRNGENANSEDARRLHNTCQTRGFSALGNEVEQLKLQAGTSDMRNPVIVLIFLLAGLHHYVSLEVLPS